MSDAPTFSGGEAPRTPAPLRASIIIPTFNRRDILNVLMAYLVKQTVPLREWELVIVDDGSTDDTLPMLQGWQTRYPDLRLLYHWQQNQGPGKARNEGIRLAGAEIVCVLDSDAMPAPDWLEEILKGYDNPLLAGVGGRIHTHQSRGIINEYNLYKKFNEVPGGFGGSEITFLMTGSMSHRRDVLLAVGGFNQNYPHFGDDNELGERVRLLGYHYAYNPKSEADHHHRDTFESLLRRFYWLGHGCFDNEMDMASRLTNRSTHRFFLWITRGMFLKNVLALMGALPRRLKEKSLPVSRRVVFWAIDVVVEVAIWMGVAHFYLGKFLFTPWEKSLYPWVYYTQLGAAEHPCPVCESQHWTRTFFTEPRDPAVQIIHRQARCNGCGHLFLQPLLEAPKPAVPLQSCVPRQKRTAFATAFLPGHTQTSVLGADDGFTGWLTTQPVEVTGPGHRQPVDVMFQWGEISDTAVMTEASLLAHLARLGEGLRPGGRLVFECLNGGGLFRRWAGPGGCWRLPQCSEWLSAANMETTLSRAGFVLEKMDSVTEPGALRVLWRNLWQRLFSPGANPPLLGQLRRLFNQRPPQPPVAEDQEMPSPTPAAGPISELLFGLLARWLDTAMQGDRLLVAARKKG